MYELQQSELEQVNGGIVPIIAAGIGAAGAIIAAVIVVSSGSESASHEGPDGSKTTCAPGQDLTVTAEAVSCN
ncbi:class IIb bacteriocin, lactobin A/cerein 7B family [Paraferrimonas haliotis]|uniref:Class IIb bacteriocin, lactobin A/cerein 7B family n=1 Tax=Paraferrimonas haliotis TaxID=2013866 RepID=A0AA37WVQ0_9GAMM|nr:class IIb bacteriocin, lactobin A/cerein 7B family [Paraferrimonas haliotis]GLS82848.1 hypothetical protein GCM10007894_08250 [Paraferrimonas haliotis]